MSLCHKLSVLKLLRESRMKYTIPVFALLYIAGFVLLRNVPLLSAALRPCGMFYVGMLTYIYRDRIRLYKTGAAGALLVFLIGLQTGFLEPVLLFSLPYLLLYLAFGTKKKLDVFGKHGDISYGMYLTAWPAEQCLVQYLGSGIPVWMHALLTFVIAVVCGKLLNRFVEQPVQRWSAR